MKELAFTKKKYIILIFLFFWQIPFSSVLFHVKRDYMPTILDESIDTFEQNKRFLSASLTSLIYKQTSVLSIANPPLPLFNVAKCSVDTFTWLQHLKGERGLKCQNWRLKNSCV